MVYKIFKNESELVSATRDWLVADGWEVYFEVAPWGAGAQRADIVAVRDGIISVVECKMSFTLSLLEQCDSWKKHAHYVWASIPYGRRNKFALKIAEWMGIGLLMISGSSGHRENRVCLEPSLFRKASTKAIRKSLHEDQKQTAPGASHSFITPFRNTCNNLIRLVSSKGGKMLVKSAIDGISHHYGSSSVARSSLVKRTEQGIIPEISVVREGRSLYFVIKSQL